MRLIELPTKLQKAYMLVELISIYYEHEAAGGTCHILLDDGNYDCAASCLEYASENNDFWGATIAEMLLEFTEEEIEQIVSRPWEITQQVM